MKKRKDKICRREPSGLPDFPRFITLWEVFFPLGSTVDDARAWMRSHDLKYDPSRGPTLVWTYRPLEDRAPRLCLTQHDPDPVHIPDFQI